MFKKFLSKYLFLIIGFILIIGLSFTTKHSDLIGISSVVDRAYVGHNLDFYKNIFGGDKAVSSPIAYLTDLFFYSLLKITHIINFHIYNFTNDNYFDLNLFQIGILKIKYLLSFIICLFVFGKISKNYDKKKWLDIVSLFILSPVLIFFPFSQGNNDIYPVMFMLISLLFGFKKRNYLSMFFLALSAATKNYAVFLFIPAALIMSERKIWPTIKYLIIAGLTLLLTYGLYYKDIYHFLSAGGEGLFIFNQTVSFLGNSIIFVLIYCFILLNLMFNETSINIKNNYKDIFIKYYFLIISLFYVTSFFIPQWFVWIVPLFILIIYKNKKLFWIYILLNTTFFIHVFINWGNNLDFNLFNKILPFLSKVPSFFVLVSSLNINIDLNKLIYSAFISLFLFFIFLFIKSKNENFVEKKFFLFSLLPILVFFLINILYVFTFINYKNYKNKDWYDLGLSSHGDVIGVIINSGQFYQTFKSPKNNLKGINLFLSTYSKKITTPYKLVLFDETCKNKILESEIEIAKIDDNKYREVIFSEVKDSKDKEYCFTIEPTLKQVDTPITLSYSKYDSYASGELILNGKNIKNEDVVFQLIYPLK